MAAIRHPEGLRPGDVVSPLFNPRKTIVFTCTGIARLGAVLQNCNPTMVDEIVRVVYGTDPLTGEPAKLTIELGDPVRLVSRDGKEVAA